MKNLFLYVILLFLGSITFAQTYSISGQITDRKNAPISGSLVLLMQMDSTVLKEATTDDTTGRFAFNEVPNNDYIIYVQSFEHADFFKKVSVLNASVDLKQIVLKKRTINLNEFVVTGQAVPVVQKDDTSEYSAAAFKVNPDASAEDLVTKMPGVIIQDGKIQAQGTEVTKVLVDGKPFFGKDPSAALKNLPAEAIDKIQVYDAKSDQAQFTGFDDGDLSKAINIITKLPFRNGMFGRGYIGGGYEDKWRAGLIGNLFKNSKRVTVMLNSNNINEQNFSIDDIMGVMGSMSGGSGNRMRMRGGGFGGGFGGGGRGGGGGEFGSFMVSPQSGINTTNSLGINFLDQWGKVEFTGSYFFNYTKNETTSNTDRTYITPQTQGLTYNEEEKSNSININHRFNFKIDYKIDSMNSILFQPSLTIQNLDASSDASEKNMFNRLLISDVFSKNTNDRTALNASLPILYRHSFEKKGRTFSANLTPGYNQSNGVYEQNYINTSFDTSGTNTAILSADTVDQNINQNKKGFTFSGNFVYTEPLSDKFSLMINYTGNYNQNNSKKETFDNEDVSSFETLDTLLSNNFKSKYYSNLGGLSLRYSEAKWFATAGLSVQNSQLINNQEFPQVYDLNKSFINYLPSAEFQYRFSKEKNLRINYRTSTREPSIDQLQEVLDNSNPSQLSIGNNQLDQTWQNSLSFRFSSTNPSKSTNFFAMFNASYTKDYIGRDSYIANKVDTVRGIIIQPGSQLTTYMNFDNSYSLRTFVNYGFLIKPIKSNLNINASANYSNTPARISEVLNNSQSTSLGVGFVLSSNISESFDFMLFSNSNANFVDNTMQSSSNSKYFRQNVRLRLNVMPFSRLALQTEVSDEFYSDFAGNDNQNYLLWNASIAFKLLKSRKLELKFSVYDILKQTENLSRNITETYYEDVLTNTLSQYFMLSLTWNFTTFKGGNPDMMKRNNDDRDRGFRR